MYWWRDPHRQKLFYQCKYDGLVPKTLFIYDFFFSDKKSKGDLDVSTINCKYKVHKSISPWGFLTSAMIVMFCHSVWFYSYLYDLLMLCKHTCTVESEE